jgi:uncharacterized protein (DUF39 family)
MVKGDLKKMKPEYLKGATFHNYGVTLYVGIGVPIPIIDEELAKNVAIRDREIYVKVVDYGVRSRDRPVVQIVSYAELKSGKVEIRGRTAKTACTSSIEIARKIMVELKKWISEGMFFLTEPVERLPLNVEYHHMKMV